MTSLSSTTTPTRAREEDTLAVGDDLQHSKRQKTDSPHSTALETTAGVSADFAMLKLIKKREDFRAQKNWAKADEVRETLRDMGISLFDKTKEWRSADGRRGAIIQGTDNTPCTLTTAEIIVLITEREQARSDQNWTEADRLRMAMREKGIELSDQDKMWRTNTGKQGFINTGQMQDGKNPGAHKDETDLQIEELISQREKARKNGDWATADKIRDQLRDQNVEINDSEKIWTTRDGRLGIIQSWSSNGSLRTSEIMALLQRRQKARAQKDWKTSDKLRDELRSRGCAIYDKVA